MHRVESERPTHTEHEEHLMAKRGSTRPWRIRFEWANGVKGTETRAASEEARSFVRELERTATTSSRAMRVTGTIQHRDHAAPAVTFDYAPPEPGDMDADADLRPISELWPY